MESFEPVLNGKLHEFLVPDVAFTEMDFHEISIGGSLHLLPFILPLLLHALQTRWLNHFFSALPFAGTGICPNDTL